MHTRQDIERTIRRLIAKQTSELLPEETITFDRIRRLIARELRVEAKDLAEITVRRAVRDLSAAGVFRSAGRRGLVVAKPRPLGLIVSEIEDTFLGLVIRGLVEEARRRGRSVIVYNTRLDPELERLAVEELLPITDGIIIVPVRDRSRGEIVRMVQRAGKPLVCVEREFNGLPADAWPLIASDNVEGGRLAARSLISSLRQANGTKAMSALFVVGRDSTTGQRMRREGFEREVGIEKQMQIRRTYELNPPDCGYRILTERLDTALELGKPRSEFRQVVADAKRHGRRCGVFCMADAIALALIGVLADDIYGLNIRVPDDLLIMGFDDLPYAEPIGLSTVRQDFEEIGRHAVQALLDGQKFRFSSVSPQDRRTTSVNPEAVRR